MYPSYFYFVYDYESTIYAAFLRCRRFLFWYVYSSYACVIIIIPFPFTTYPAAQKSQKKTHVRHRHNNDAANEEKKVNSQSSQSETTTIV